MRKRTPNKSRRSCFAFFAWLRLVESWNQPYTAPPLCTAPRPCSGRSTKPPPCLACTLPSRRPCEAWKQQGWWQRRPGNTQAAQHTAAARQCDASGRRARRRAVWAASTGAKAPLWQHDVQQEADQGHGVTRGDGLAHHCPWQVRDCRPVLRFFCLCRSCDAPADTSVLPLRPTAQGRYGAAEIECPF